MQNYPPHTPLKGAQTMIVFLVLAIAGCDLAGPNMAETNVKIGDSRTTAVADPPVTFGRLAFADREALDAFLQTIFNRETVVLDQFEARNRFISLRTDTKRLEEQLEEQTAWNDDLFNSQFEVVKDPFLATVLNADGEIQIGQQVYKVTRNFEYEVSIADADLLSSIPLRSSDGAAVTESHSAHPDVSVYAVSHQVESLGQSKLSAVEGSNCTITFDKKNKKRLGGATWYRRGRYHISAGAVTRSKRKAGWRWRLNEIEKIGLSGTYDVSGQGIEIHGTLDTESTNAHTAEATYFSSSIKRGVVVTGSISSDHTGTRKGVDRECSTGRTVP